VNGSSEVCLKFHCIFRCPFRYAASVVKDWRSNMRNLHCVSFRLEIWIWAKTALDYLWICLQIIRIGLRRFNCLKTDELLRFKCLTLLLKSWGSFGWFEEMFCSLNTSIKPCFRFLKITVWITVSLESSRQDIFIDMVGDSFIFKSNPIVLSLFHVLTQNRCGTTSNRG